MTEIKGNIEAGDNYKIGIAVARWNSFITEKLLEGAREVLKIRGIREDNIFIAWCPGAYEIPLTAAKLAAKTDGVIALGAVIRGETPHFDYVCDAVNRGVLELNIKTGKPVAFGVLTTDDVGQARARSDAESEKGNKGAEAALALLEMLSVVEQIDQI